MESSWPESVEAFSMAAEWFRDSAAAVGDRWAEPGLGEWDVRSLVGHTARALLTVENYLARPAERVTIASAVDYYLAAHDVAAGPEVAERGRQAGEALGDDPTAAVAEIVARVVPLLAAHDGSELVMTVAGGMRLADYLPTRTFELVVHTADLSRALGVEPRVPEVAARQALHVVAELALREGVAARLLMGVTGRTGLPTEFSVL